MESMNLEKEMSKLQGKVLYSSRLIEPEEDDRCVWNKQTVAWYVSNLNKVRKQVAFMAKDLNPNEVEIITANLSEYLEKGKDWGDLSEDEENHLTLEQYVYKGASYCIKRFKHEKSKENAMRALPIMTDDDEEKSALDLIGDSRLENVYDDVCCNFEEALEQLQYKRFFYGLDIYNLLYIAFLGRMTNNENYQTLLNAFGISKKELQTAYKKVQADEDFNYLLTNIRIKMENDFNLKDTLEQIGKYVYGRKKIYEALQCMC